MNDRRELVKLGGLQVGLGRKQVILGTDLSVRGGEFVTIVGPNGAGKTTLLKAVAGLIPSRGRIEIGGAGLAGLARNERARRMAYLPQGHVFHWPLAVADIVALGRLPRAGGSGLSEPDRIAVARAMEQTGVREFANRPVTALSGGERARVALARVLATEAPILLTDEPTASLDPRYQLLVLDILRKHATNGGAVIAVLHDLGLAARQADRLVILDKGRIVADGAPREVLTRARLAETFGVNAQVVTLVDAPVVIPWSAI